MNADELNPLSIVPIPFFDDNYAWVIHSMTDAVVVDPGDATPVLRYVYAHRLMLSSVLLTHHHTDHCGGAAEIKRATGCTVIGPHDARLPGVDRYAVHDATFDVLSCTIRVIAVPGHTLTHVAYHLPLQQALFTGDTLFGAGCGRIFEGSYADMYRSLMTCAACDEQTRIFAGHEYTLNNLAFALSLEPDNAAIRSRFETVHTMREHSVPSLPSTLAEEKVTNPFLRCDSSTLRAGLHMTDCAANLEVFTALRAMRDTF